MKNSLRMAESSALVQMDSIYEAYMAPQRSVHCVREVIYISSLPTASHFTEGLSQTLQRCIALTCLNCGARWTSERDGILHRAQSLLSTPCGMLKSPITLAER